MRHLEALAGDPARDRDRRAGADPFEAVLDQRVDDLAGLGGVRDGLPQHVGGARLQFRTETPDLIPRLPKERSRRGR